MKTIEHGKVGDEKALCFRFHESPYELTFIEDEQGSQLHIAVDERRAVFTAVLNLDADQVRALGLFCARQFMCGEPHELLSRIELSAAGVAMALEAWNDRARADEEHPPYDMLVRELEMIKGAVEELRKGLKPHVD